MKKYAGLLISLFVYHSFAQIPVTPQADGTSNYYFQVGNVYFQVDAGHGARIDSYKLDGTEFLYVEHNKGVEDMYGSTNWLSPQDLWGWPPQAIIDTDPYSGGISGNKIILTSGIAAANNMNFQIRKTFSADLQDSSISIDYTIINKSTTSKSFASWEIMRVPTGGLSFFPVNGQITGDLAPVFTINDNIAWWDYDSTRLIFNKAFADGAEGWLAHIDNNRLIHIKTFTDAKSNFPNNKEREIEFWANNQMYYNEIEKHSEYKTVAANDSTTLSIRWYLRQLPENIKVFAGNPEIISFINNIVNPGESPVSVKSTVIETLLVYPNPAGNEISFKMKDESSKGELFLYNNVGKLILRRNVANGENIHLGSVINGIYFYSFRSAGETRNGKLIIRR